MLIQCIFFQRLLKSFKYHLFLLDIKDPFTVSIDQDVGSGKTVFTCVFNPGFEGLKNKFSCYDEIVMMTISNRQLHKRTKHASNILKLLLQDFDLCTIDLILTSLNRFGGCQSPGYHYRRFKHA